MALSKRHFHHNHHNKKGNAWLYIGSLILAVLSFYFLFDIIWGQSAKAETATQEKLCEGSNLVKYKYETSAGWALKKIYSPSRVCNTLDKGDLPTKEFKVRQDLANDKERAKAEVRQLMEKCWKMWLEGKEQNMFDKAYYQTDSCFVCYTFTIADSAEFTPKDLDSSLYETYRPTDMSSKCASGDGGKCVAGTACSGSSDFPDKVSSTTCKPNEVCCVSKNRQNICKEKGGVCGKTALLGYQPYSKWICPNREVCYVPQSQSASYYNYFQGEKGVGGGPGMIVTDGLASFSPGPLYAVTFVSPSKTWTVTGTGGGLLGVFGAEAATAYLTSWILPPVGAAITALAVAGGTYYAVTQFSGTPRDINYLLVSQFNSVPSKCTVERGVSS